MNCRRFALLLVPVLLLGPALLLTGCVSAREVPPPISDDELRSYLQERLDAAWLNTGLDGTADRPLSDPATLVEQYKDGNNARDQSECLSGLGITSWGTDEQNGGPVFLSGDGSPADPSLQLAWYGCFAAHPTDSTYLGSTLSRFQAEYLYDYYQEWVVPCLTLKGFHVAVVPSREEYLAGASFGWIPYYALEPGVSEKDPYGDGGAAMFELADQCGDPFPGMPYGEQYGFR